MLRSSPRDAFLLQHVLPQVLGDFFPLRQTLTLILEQLAGQTASPSSLKLLAPVVRSVFRAQQQRHHSEDLVEWTMLATSNFLQVCFVQRWSTCSHGLG